MINEERLVNRFLEYVQIDSPTFEEKDFKERLKKDLEELGLKVYEDNSGENVNSNSGNLIVKLDGDSDLTLMFSAHMDTVDPSRGIKPEIRDGIIYSDGTTILGGDDKGGVAAIMEMLTVLVEKEIPHHNIEVVFNIAEEKGLYGSLYLDYSKLNADMGFVFDCDGDPGSIIVQGPSQNQIDVKFKGKAAHAGVSPEDGISAIQIAAEAISNMKLLRVDEETTANIGFINGGGPTNIVTDEVEIKGEARSLNDEKLKKQTEHMIECVKKAQEKYGIEAEIKVSESYKAFKIDEDALPVRFVKEANEKLGIETKLITSGGGSDTNNYNIKGIPSVNLAIGQNKPHSVEENIAIEDLVNTSKIALEIAKID